MINWLDWWHEPLLVGLLIVAGVLWAVLAGPYRPRLLAAAGYPATTPFPRRAAWNFYGALVVAYLAVGSPLHEISVRYLLSVHMLQHQLLIYPAAMFFLLGVPGWMVDAAVRPTPVFVVARFFTRPAVCAIVFLVVFGVWHAPWLYCAAITNEHVHLLEHVMFFVAGVFSWWPVLSRSRRLPPLGYGTQMLYLLAVIIGMMPIHAFITFSQHVVYAPYEHAPQLFAGWTSLDDQLLSGVSMQMMATAISTGAITVAFYKWYKAGERRGAAGDTGAHPRLSADR